MNMTIMCVPTNFKIKKKTDVEKFINECMVSGCEYFMKITDEFAVFLDKKKDGSVSVLEKRWDLYNPFNPLLEVASTSNNCYEHSVNDYIWKYRKYINATWFNGRED